MGVNNLKKSLLIVLVIAIFIIIGLIAGQRIIKLLKTPLTLDLVTLTEEEIISTVIIPGTIRMLNEEFIYYIPEKGAIEQINVNIGDKVNKDTILFNYKNEQLKMDIRKQQLIIKSEYLKINSLENEEIKLAEREKNLAKETENKVELEQIKSEKEEVLYNRQLANIDLKQALLQQEIHLEQEKELVVKSKTSGVIMEINEPSSNTLNNEPFIYIGDTSRLMVYGYISEYDALSVKEGQKAVIKTDILPNEKWFGTVEYVSALPDNTEFSNQSDSYTKVQYPIHVSIKTPKKIKPGFQVITEIETEKHLAYTLPIEALLQRGDENIVYCVKNGKAVSKSVEIGTSTETKVEILKGINNKDKIIINPPEKLKEGMEVTAK
ncbi:efflux RND transporter periplasmic adaptor subunit [Paenibacillus alvei]